MANSICVQREMVSGDGSHVFWSLVTCFWDLVLGNMSSGVSFHVVWCLIFLCQVLGALFSFAQYNVFGCLVTCFRALQRTNS